ncbi:MAG: hypothetical protein ACOX81_03675 [Candidatus Heteroscillospira sp.]|jgi:hypothetical protein
MRYPVSLKGTKTLTSRVQENIEWQKFDFDYGLYFDATEDMICIANDVYNRIFEMRIHEKAENNN